MTQKKIVITRFALESQLGGEELHTIELAKHWRKIGHDVVFWGDCQVLHQLFRDNKFRTVKIKAGLPIPVSTKNLISFVRQLPKVWRQKKFMANELEAEHPNFVFALGYLDKILLWPRLKKLKTPYVFMEHARIGKWFWLNPCLLSYILGAINGKVITVSELMRAKFRFIPNVKVIVNGINTEIFKPTLQKKKSGTPLLVKVARLSDDKGIQTFLDFLALLKQRDQEFRAVILGNGPKNDFFNDKIGNLDLSKNVEIINDILSTKDIAELLEEANCSFLVSNKFDPFGLVAAESLAVGTPVIVSSLTGISSYLPSKFVVSPANPEDLYAKYIDMKNRPPAKNEILQISEQFISEKMYKEYDQLVESSTNAL